MHTPLWYLYFRSVFAMPLLGIFVFGSLILNTVRNHQVIYDILNVLSFTCTKQIDAKFIYMKIYIQYIYCKLFVFKIADIRLKVLHKNSMNVKKKNEINKNIYLKITMNAYCLKFKWSIPKNKSSKCYILTITGIKKNYLFQFLAL